MARCLLVLILALHAAVAQAQSLVLLADLNGRYGSVDYHPRVAAAIASVIALRPAAVVLAGDMIAGQATPPLSPDRLTEMWAAFERVVAAPLRSAGIVVIPVAGNHDASAYQTFAGDRRAYERYWLAHRPPLPLAEGSSYPWHFAVSLGAMRVVALYATLPGELDPVQQQFLQSQLSAVTGGDSIALVATHLPLYPVARGREREIVSLDLPQVVRAEAWVSGHHHAWYPGVSRQGRKHIAIPALGGNRRQWLGSDAHSPFGFVRIAATGEVMLHAAPDFEPAQIHELPARIGGLELLQDPNLALPSVARGVPEN